MATKTVHVTLPNLTRPARIAAVHAAAGFLATNPELPMPTSVDLTAHDLTEAELQHLAEVYGVEIIQRSASRWIEIPIMIESLHGVEATYVAFGPRAAQS